MLPVILSCLFCLQLQGQLEKGDLLSPGKTALFKVTPRGEKVFLLNLRSDDCVQIRVEQYKAWRKSQSRGQAKSRERSAFTTLGNME